MADRGTWREDYERSSRRDTRFETMSGVPLEPVYGPDGAELPGQFPYTRGPYASMYRSRLWTMRQFAGFGSAADTNERFKELLRAGGDGLSTAFDMPTLLGCDSDDPLARGEVGRAGVAVDTQADMETALRRDRSGPGLDVDDHQLTGRTPPGHVHRSGRPHGGRAGAAVGHAAERHLEGVPGSEGVRVPAAAVGAPGDRRHAVLRGGDAPVASGLHLGLPHPGGRIDGGPGARVHLGQRIRLRRGGLGGGYGGRRFRAETELLLQCAQRLLRGDRQVSCRPAHLGPLDARPLRRARRPLDPAPLPYADGRRVAHGAAARGESGARGHRGVGRRAGRHPEPAHRRVRRGAGAADRARGTPGAAHPAGDRRGVGGRPRGGSARWVVVRRGAHRRTGAPGGGGLQPCRRRWVRLHARRRLRLHRRRLVHVRDRGRRLRVPVEDRPRRMGAGRGQRLRRGRRRGALDAGHRSGCRGGADRAPGPGEAGAGRRRRAASAVPARAPKPSIRR